MLVAAPAFAQDLEEDDIGAEIDLTPAEESGDDLQPPLEELRGEEPARASSGSGEKVFDWEKHKDQREVPHPFAEKGLIRITKDRTYIYKVDETDQKRAASFRIGVFNPVNLENPEAQGVTGATFEENYDQATNPAIMFDYEWQLWRAAIGKIGIRAGAGLFIAQGNGHFSSEINRDRKPREIFTFWAVPSSAGAVYRLQIWDKQLFVPYAEGGGMGIPFGEFRDDDRPPKWGGAFAAYYAAGLAINLTYFDSMSGIQLDREYGINRIYLTAEYRGIVGLSDNYDFSSDLINGGLLMEF